jgi:MFS family permease
MYYQLFYSLPVFIDQWVNTASLYHFLHNISPTLAEAIGTKQGTIEAEMMTTIDALYIVILQILVSSAVMKWKAINTIIVGFIIAAIGIGLTFASQNPFFILVALLIFGIGEMSSSPKITEYIGSIAPKDKKALYMGTSFLPVSGGFLLAGIISGSVYQSWSDKYELAQKEILKNHFSIPSINEHFTKNDLFNALAEKMHYNSIELTKYLWDTYNPSKIWILIAGIGIGTAILMLIYNRYVKK